MRLPGAASHAGFDENPPETLASVFDAAITALERARIDHLLVGGLASAELGRPRCSADIDLLVRPIDALPALDALGAEGFDTEETNPHWIFKATHCGVLIDLLFKGPRDIYLDAEMLARARAGRVMGRSVRVIPPEDLLLMKALVHDEETPRHWHDALGLIASGALDWEYLVRRASRGSRRVLSLLLYALSIDLLVPASAIEALYARIFREGAADVR